MVAARSVGRSVRKAHAAAHRLKPARSVRVYRIKRQQMACKWRPHRASPGWQPVVLGARTPWPSIEALVHEIEPALLIIGGELRRPAIALLEVFDPPTRCLTVLGGSASAPMIAIRGRWPCTTPARTARCHLLSEPGSGRCTRDAAPPALELVARCCRRGGTSPLEMRLHRLLLSRLGAGSGIVAEQRRPAPGRRWDQDEEQRDVDGHQDDDERRLHQLHTWSSVPVDLA